MKTQNAYQKSYYHSFWQFVSDILQLAPSIVTSNNITRLLALMSVQLASNSAQGQTFIESNASFVINVPDNGIVDWPAMTQTNSSIIQAWSYRTNTSYPNSVYIRCLYLDGTVMTPVINANVNKTVVKCAPPVLATLSDNSVVLVLSEQQTLASNGTQYFRRLNSICEFSDTKIVTSDITPEKFSQTMERPSNIAASRQDSIMFANLLTENITVFDNGFNETGKTCVVCHQEYDSTRWVEGIQALQNGSYVVAAVSPWDLMNVSNRAYRIEGTFFNPADFNLAEKHLIQNRSFPVSEVNFTTNEHSLSPSVAEQLNTGQIGFVWSREINATSTSLDVMIVDRNGQKIIAEKSIANTTTANMPTLAATSSGYVTTYDAGTNFQAMYLDDAMQSIINGSVNIGDKGNIVSPFNANDTGEQSAVICFEQNRCLVTWSTKYKIQSRFIRLHLPSTAAPTPPPTPMPTTTRPKTLAPTPSPTSTSASTRPPTTVSTLPTTTVTSTRSPTTVSSSPTTPASTSLLSTLSTLFSMLTSTSLSSTTASTLLTTPIQTSPPTTSTSAANSQTARTTAITSTASFFYTTSTQAIKNDSSSDTTSNQRSTTTDSNSGVNSETITFPERDTFLIVISVVVTIAVVCGISLSGACAFAVYYYRKKKNKPNSEDGNVVEMRSIPQPGEVGNGIAADNVNLPVVGASSAEQAAAIVKAANEVVPQIATSTAVPISEIVGPVTLVTVAPVTSANLEESEEQRTPRENVYGNNAYMQLSVKTDALSEPPAASIDANAKSAHEAQATLRTKKHDRDFKVIIMGSRSSTASLLSKYEFVAQDRLPDHHLHTLATKINGFTIRLTMYNFATFDKKLESSTADNTKGVMIVYDANDPDSFNKVLDYLDTAIKNIPDPNFNLILVRNNAGSGGNSNKYVITTEEIKAIIERHPNVIFVEASSATIDQEFFKLAELICERIPQKEKPQTSPSGLITANSIQGAKGITHKQLLDTVFQWELNQAIERSLIDAKAKKEKTVQTNNNLEANANRYGHRCKDVPGDGNCFFHAILDQLQRIDPIAYHATTTKELRERTTQHVFDHFDLYRDAIDDDPNIFMSKIVQDRVWADHIMILALSRTLNMTLVIIRDDGADPTVIRQNDSEKIIYLGYQVGVHYQSLVFDRRLNKPMDTINEHIENESIDNFGEQVPSSSSHAMS
jgi:hypothetical protein